MVEHNLAAKNKVSNLGKDEQNKRVCLTNAEIAQLVEHNLAAKNKVSNLGKDERNKRACLTNAEIAQLVEHNLAKVGVASSSLVFRSL